MDLDSVTRLDWSLDRPSTTLRLTGDIGSILKSTCGWSPEGAGDEPGAVRAVGIAGGGLPFGLGAAAFGEPPAQAVRRLGEYALVDGESWWTPAARPVASRHESPDSPVLTPFLLQWDDMASAVARLECASPVPLIRWYEYLLHRLTRLGACRTGMIAVEVIADTPARLIVDKQLVRAPLREHRPHDKRIITDEAHLDSFFIRNGTSRAYDDGSWCTVVMVGIVVDPQRAAAAYGGDILKRAFYATPGISASATAIQHTHALVTAQLSTTGQPSDWPGAATTRFTAATSELAAEAHAVQVTHIENDTRLYRAEARVGAVDEIRLH